MQIIPSNTWRSFFIAFGIFLVAGALYFLPSLQGKELEQGDVTQFRGSASEIIKYREMGRSIYWTNAMFSGMPNYGISVINPSNFIRYVPLVFRKGLGGPYGLFVLMSLGFFVLMMATRIDLRIAIGASLAYALSSYFIIVLAAGHAAKFHAMAYLPVILAGFIWAFRRKSPWIGAAVTGVGTALEINAGHPQMAYYFFFVLLAVVIYELQKALRHGQFQPFLKRGLMVLLAAVLGVATQYPYLSRTLHYSAFSTRGASELSAELLGEGEDQDGLDKGYITDWSYGVGETFSWLIPNFKGGVSQQLATQEKALEAVNPRFKRAVGGQSQYWGNQPFVSGPVYIGAFVLLLGLFGFFFLRPGYRIPYLIALVLMTMLSWGKNFEALTNFFIDYVPLYDKFRAVSSIMVIPSFLFPFISALTLQRLLEKPEALQQASGMGSLNFQKLFYVVAGVLVAFCGLSYVAPDMVNSFLSNQEASQLPSRLSKAGFSTAQANSFMAQLEKAREVVFQADAARSLFVLLLGVGLFFVWQRRILSGRWLAISLSILMVGDLWMVDRRYLGTDNFVEETTAQKPQKTPADQAILRDDDPYFRVLNLTVSPFNDATTSFFHKSIGGYSGIKLKKYQELIDFYLQGELQTLMQGLQNGKPQPQQLFSQTPLLNALNTKYLIVNKNGRPLENPRRHGNAWFVSGLESVPDADAEIQALGQVNLREKAVVREPMRARLASGPNVPFAPSGQISLSSYDPEKLVYQSKSPQDGLVVFSEIYFPEGWKLQVDGEETPLIRTNYLMRGAVIPAGAHTITMTFEKDFQTARMIGILAHVLLLGLVVTAVLMYRRRSKVSQ